MMKLLRVLKIFGAIILVICAAFLALALVIGLFYGIADVEGFASVLMLVLLFGLFIYCNVSWKNTEMTAVIIGLIAFVGMFVDSYGNYFYNFPLEWLFAPEGTTLFVDAQSEHIGDMTYYSYDFLFVDENGKKVDSLSALWVYPFRYLEYLVIGSIVAFATMPFVKEGKFSLPKDKDDRPAILGGFNDDK